MCYMSVRKHLLIVINLSSLKKELIVLKHHSVFLGILKFIYRSYKKLSSKLNLGFKIYNGVFRGRVGRRMKIKASGSPAQRVDSSAWNKVPKFSMVHWLKGKDRRKMWGKKEVTWEGDLKLLHIEWKQSCHLVLASGECQRSTPASLKGRCT